MFHLFQALLNGERGSPLPTLQPERRGKAGLNRPWQNGRANPNPLVSLSLPIVLEMGSWPWPPFCLICPDRSSEAKPTARCGRVHKQSCHGLRPPRFLYVTEQVAVTHSWQSLGYFVPDPAESPTPATQLSPSASHTAFPERLEQTRVRRAALQAGRTTEASGGMCRLTSLADGKRILL